MKLRLVTDNRELNKALQRLDWPFMSSSAVRRQIDPETQVLPWGRFRYECLPMGLRPSGDKEATRKQEGCLKSVDDCLQQAASYCQLKTRLVSLFMKFREKNIKVKSSMFRVGIKVKFG